MFLLPSFVKGRLAIFFFNDPMFCAIILSERNRNLLSLWREVNNLEQIFW